MNIAAFIGDNNMNDETLNNQNPDPVPVSDSTPDPAPVPDPTPDPASVPDPEPVPVSDEPTVPISTVEAIKAGYEARIAEMKAEYQNQIDAQNEVIRGVFSNKNKNNSLKNFVPTDAMASKVAANNEKSKRRKF